jgi:hypothetical protein
VRGSRWLIFAPVAILALFAPQPAQASQIGLLVRGYSITEIPPTKSDLAYPICGSSVEPFINATWDGQPYEQCGVDSFMLHYTGYLQIPVHDTIEFWIASDDGGTIKIGTEEFGVWEDQGCSATETGLIEMSAGTQAVDAWFYENGGGTCFMFAWNIDGRGWEIVQPEFFTSDPLTPETTVPDTTVPIETTAVSTTLETTTTIPSTTTSSSTIPYVQTTVLQASTSSSSTTSSTTSTTTTTTSPIEEIQQPTTGTTTATTFVEPTPETTVVDTTLPEVTTNATDPSADTLPFVTVTSPPEPPVSLPEPLETSVPVEPTPTTLLFPDGTEPPEELSDEDFDAALEDLDGALPDQITAIVDTLLESDLSSEQATELITNVQVLTALSSDQATQVFAEIQEAQLSEAAAETIAEALNNSDVPQEVKEAFEDQINIFGNDGFSNYVPIDSNVSVAVRRTIIAGTTVLVAMPPPSARRR